MIERLDILCEWATRRCYVLSSGEKARGAILISGSLTSCKCNQSLDFDHRDLPIAAPPVTDTNSSSSAKSTSTIGCQGSVSDSQLHYKLVDNGPYSSSKAASLATRLVQSNNPNRSKYGSDDEDDDAIFAELEEEIENDSNVSIREHGLQVLKAE